MPISVGKMTGSKTAFDRYHGPKVGNVRLWKHEPPVEPFANIAKQLAPGERVLVVSCARDLICRLRSMGDYAHDLFPIPRRTRSQKKPEWLLGQVEFSKDTLQEVTKGNGKVWSSAVDMWGGVHDRVRARAAHS